jgi:hypothetical protein
MEILSMMETIVAGAIELGGLQMQSMVSTINLAFSIVAENLCSLPQVPWCGCVYIVDTWTPTVVEILFMMETIIRILFHIKIKYCRAKLVKNQKVLLCFTSERHLKYHR